MIKDLTHNKIIADTVTDGFISSVDSVLLPIVEQKVDGVRGIQMYEDHLADGFMKDGRWYYPLTVFTDDGARAFWISWSVDKKRFKGAVPYSYIGEGEIDFRYEEEVPQEFSEKIAEGKIAAFEGNIRINIHSASDDPLFLVGKYSQSFIDEMREQLTARICSLMKISDIANSVISLQLIFAPETYMEHTSENVTYRRLRMVDKTSAPRDFWIKWTRIGSKEAYSVSDTPAPGTVVFELGEDVSQKIREREYRFLINQSADKFRAAMTRKNVTDWRELVKRAIKRGELIALGMEEEEEKIIEESADALITSIIDEDLPKEEPITREEPAAADEPAFGDTSLEDALRKILGQSSVSEVEEPWEDAPSEAIDAPENDVPWDTDENASEPEVAIPENKEPTADLEAQLRLEIEARLRLEYESAAREKAEAEARRFSEERERLRLENERLQREAKRLEEIRLENENRLKAEIEAKARAEAREKERLAEAAMLAVEEKQRLEREQAEMEARRREAERIAEAERAKAEALRRAEEERRLKEERARIEKEAEEAEAARQRAVNSAQNGYTFTSKRVLFFFNSEVEKNITSSMEAIIRRTLEENRKTGVPINIRASIVSEKSVCLDFVRIPEEEEELLISIVQALGKGGLGIVKARVE